MKSGLVFLAVILLGGDALLAREVRRAIPAQSPDADLAAFLAGNPVTPGSPLEALQQSAAYRKHQEEMGRLWAHYSGHYFEPMQMWSAIALAPYLDPSRPLYYFFGGPDAISSLGLFPEAPVRILGGLEPVGVIAAPQDLDPATLEASLATLRKSVEVILSYGHFITKDMKTDLEASSFRGALPVLFTFLSLAGGEILSCSYFAIGKDGLSQETGNRLPDTGIPGARIVFRRSPEAPVQSLLYVQANVANYALRPEFLRWAATFGRGNAWLKAASYLMHSQDFSRIRSFLLEESDAILQDDSGIPLQQFLDGRWRLRFFGVYSGVLDIFKSYHQQKLDAAFASPDGPLPFGTGYKWRPGESNLMLAVRSNPARALPADAP